MSYLQQTKDAALQAYRHECMMFQIVAPWDSEKKIKPPRLPEILES